MHRMPVDQTVRVLMPLDSGYTKVMVESTQGVGLADGGITWDIPTRKIPFHLRRIGSRFVVRTEAIWPHPNDGAEELRDAQRDILAGLVVEEIV
jgi:hypothetical protein